MRQTLVDIRETAGYEVSTAVDGQDAVDRVTSDRPDIVVMDIRMPRRDGVSATIAMQPPPPVVILMTAWAVEDQLRAAVESNAFAVLHKPVPIQRLQSLLASIPPMPGS